MTLRQRTLSLFNIEADEGRLVRLLMLYSAGIGLAFSYFFAAAGALFLAHFDINDLPPLIMLSGLAVLLVQGLYTGVARRFSPSDLLLGSLVVLGLGVLGLWLGLRLTFTTFTGERAAAYALLIGFRVLIVVLMIGFWGLANRLFSIAQSKRLFGLISAGEMMAILIGGLLIPLWLRVIVPQDLLLIVILALGLCYAVARQIIREQRPQLARAGLSLETDSAPKSRFSPIQFKKWRERLSAPYVRLILGLYLLGWAFNVLMDFSLLERLQERYSADPVQIAAFIGLLFGLIQIGSLALKLFVAAPLLVRYGIGLSLLLTPVLLLVAALSLFLIGGLVGLGASFFWLLIGLKYAEQVLRQALHEPTTRLLYQPLPSGERASAAALVEGYSFALSALLIGGLLWLLTLSEAYTPLMGVALLLILAAAWGAMAYAAYRGYGLTLREALTRQVISGDVMLQADPTTLNILRQKLRSPQPSEVIYALDFLEALQNPAPSDHLGALLTHPAPLVQREALLRIERHKPEIDSRLLWILAESDDGGVQEAALRAYAALNASAAPPLLIPLLEADDPDLRRGSLMGLLQYGDRESVETAERRLFDLATSTLADERAFSASILAEVPNKRYYGYLLNLLDDPEPSVRRAALLAAGKLNNPQLWPTVIKCLSDHQVTTAAVSALYMGNWSVYPAMEAVFNQPQPDPTLTLQVARICGRRRDARALALLAEQFDYPNQAVQQQILTSLYLCGYRAPEAMQAKIHQRLTAEAAQATWLLACLGDIVKADEIGLNPLEEALDEAFEQGKKRIFLLLSFIYKPQTIMQASYDFSHAMPERRALAQETLEVTLARNLRPFLLPLFKMWNLPESLSRLQAHFPQEQLNPEARLANILSQPAGAVSPWIITCALYAIRELGLQQLYRRALPFLDAFDPVVRETAVWTLHSLNPDAFAAEILPKLAVGKPRAYALAQTLIQSSAAGEDRLMLLTIEKVLILKTVGIFEQVPDNILVEVAAMLDEVSLAKGEILFEQNDIGNALFIIVSGTLRIQTNRQVIADRSAREIIGDMSLLDHAPRSASAVALTPCRLLRLDQMAFDELLANHAEMAQGIIQVLAWRLRESAERSGGVAPMMAEILDRINTPKPRAEASENLPE